MRTGDKDHDNPFGGSSGQDKDNIINLEDYIDGDEDEDDICSREGERSLLDLFFSGLEKNSEGSCFWNDDELDDITELLDEGGDFDIDFDDLLELMHSGLNAGLFDDDDDDDDYYDGDDDDYDDEEDDGDGEDDGSGEGKIISLFDDI